MGKAIVVFSDGTGNSSAALQRTNVWRLYDALDRTEPDPGQRRQIAYYDNGVGTSAFKPLAIVGGVFGVGLARNLLDCYKFVCRNYEGGDELYAFGFSRGAFTIRLLVGLIAREGIVRYRDEAQLDRDAMDVIRAYRRRFGEDNKLATLLRDRRDRRSAVERAKRRLPQVRDIERDRPDVRFLGVWDTVGAYGMPIAELTRGFDCWVWPLSMPNYTLSHKVRQARHALALDDERDTFHPLLWDEVAEGGIVKKHSLDPNRLLQVWFTGMHSDVGGGYPDDSLSYVSLEWMVDEAIAAGLRLKRMALEDIRCTANAYGPMHDSRSGLGGYYRYQPRKIAARVDRPDRTTRIMRDPALDSRELPDAPTPATHLVCDPDPKGRGLLTSVKVHESVMRRIAKGTDSYAPIVLPASFSVVNRDARSDGIAEALDCVVANSAARAERQEAVWNDVWRRRVNYFSAVAVSLILLLLPLFPARAACTGPQCLLTPLINGLGAVLPDFLSPWIDAFARSPGVFILLVIALAVS